MPQRSGIAPADALCEALRQWLAPAPKRRFSFFQSSPPPRMFRAAPPLEGEALPSAWQANAEALGLLPWPEDEAAVSLDAGALQDAKQAMQNLAAFFQQLRMGGTPKTPSEKTANVSAWERLLPSLDQAGVAVRQAGKPWETLPWREVAARLVAGESMYFHTGAQARFLGYMMLLHGISAPGLSLQVEEGQAYPLEGLASTLSLFWQTKLG